MSLGFAQGKPVASLFGRDAFLAADTDATVAAFPLPGGGRFCLAGPTKKTSSVPLVFLKEIVILYLISIMVPSM